MIAVSITSHTCAEALEAVARVEGADLIELRLDLLTDFDLQRDSERLLRAAILTSAVPLIFTLRSKREVAAGETLQQVSALISTRRTPLGRDYFDFDHQSDCRDSLYLYRLYERIQGVPARIIISHHDFVGAQELKSVYQRLCALAPDVVKIAVAAQLLEDNLKVLELLKDALHPTIALAMGEAGRLSRLLTPSRGGFLTFACLSQGSEAAPGQFTLNEMLSLYRVKSIDMETAFYAILGYPVSHSASPYIHNRAFAAAGLNSVYVPIAVPAAELKEFLRVYVRECKLDWRFCGASITVPHKVAILRLLDWVDPVAARVGAVNTLVVTDAQLKGYNTDVAGALLPLKRRRDLRGLRVSVLGAGGAARAVVAGLVDEGARVTVYARDPAQSRRLCAEFGTDSGEFAEAGVKGADVLINTTPVGMNGWISDQPLPIAPQYLKGFGLVYDLVYNPERTALLEAAEAAGVETLGGLEMLVAQAAEQYRLWTGLEPPIKLMDAAARERLRGLQR